MMMHASVTPLLEKDKKDSDFKIVPVTTTFLSSSKPCTRGISRNLADDFKKKGEKPAAVFVPGDVSEKQINHFEALLARLSE